MKLCRDCKHFTDDMAQPTNCAAPGNHVVDYVNGERPRVVFSSAQSVRIDPTMCGPDAKWFVPVAVLAAA